MDYPLNISLKIHNVNSFQRIKKYCIQLEILDRCIQLEILDRKIELVAERTFSVVPALPALRRFLWRFEQILSHKKKRKKLIYVYLLGRLRDIHICFSVQSRPISNY